MYNICVHACLQEQLSVIVTSVFYFHNVLNYVITTIEVLSYPVFRVQ